MGKKEPSKGREWEKGRRDVLNKTFEELYKALPSYNSNVTLSKKVILTKALTYIQQLGHEKRVWEETSKSPQRSDGLLPSTESLKEWMQNIFKKHCELISILKKAGIIVSQELVTFHLPQALTDISSDLTAEIKQVGGKIEIKADLLETISQKKENLFEKAKENESSEGQPKAKDKSRNSSKQNTFADKTNSSQQLRGNGVSNSVVRVTSVLQNGPVMMQSSPLQLPPQLLFSSSSSNTSLQGSIPLLVSVSGVKTMNPLILVQSNALAPTPLSVQNSQRILQNGLQTRPIQPGPPGKSVKKLKKVPIPSLRQKTTPPMVVSVNAKVKKTKKLTDNGCPTAVKPLKIQKGTVKNLPNPKNQARSPKDCGETSKVNISKDLELNHPNHPAEPISASECDEPAYSDGSKNPEQDKENLADNTTLRKVDQENLNKVMNSVSNTCSGSNEDTASLNRNSSCSKTKNSVEQSHQCEKSISSSVAQDPCPPSNKRPPRTSSPLSGPVKRAKIDLQSSVSETTTHMQASECGDEGTQATSPMKVSKSSYSISALCDQQQQLLGESQILTNQSGSLVHLQQTQQLPVPQDQQESKNALQQSSEQNIQEHQGASVVMNASVRVQENCLLSEKAREILLPSMEQYIEWSEKTKSKSDRTCSSYNYYPSLGVHNNKNTFIPISDTESFKNASEPFDGGENPFVLPLHSSDISSDIFASLQVPSGGQHSESISPTAAFLLAFPLVSTSKATELLADESVCETTDSQPGMKTILQIGNLDADTPVTKCVSDFGSQSGDGSSVGFTASGLFPHSAMSSKGKSFDALSELDSYGKKSTVTEGGPQKLGSTDVGPIHKLSMNFSHKAQNKSPSKQAQSFMQKSAVQMQSSSICKPSQCEPRTNITQVPAESVPTSLQLPLTTDSSKSNVTAGVSAPQEKTPNKIHPRISGSSCSEKLPKTLTKLNTVLSTDSPSFMGCDKQADWTVTSSSSQTQALHTHNPFSDFASSSNTRTDCSFNFPISPVVFSSHSLSDRYHSNSAGESAAVTYCPSKSQSSSSVGILSWSTMSPMENSHLSRNSSKLAHFQDTFSSTKPADKSKEIQTTVTSSSILQCSNDRVPQYASQPTIMPMKSGSTLSYDIGNNGSEKYGSSTSNFNHSTTASLKLANQFNQLIASEPKEGTSSETLLGTHLTKHNPQSGNLIILEKSASGKKNHQPEVDKKQNPSLHPAVCGSSDLGKASSSGRYQHPPTDSRSNQCQTMPSMVYHHVTSESKSKTPHFNQSAGSDPKASPSVSNHSNHLNHTHSTKQSNSVHHFGQSIVSQTSKQSTPLRHYDQSSSIIYKQAQVQHNVMPSYSSSNSELKQASSGNSQYNHSMNATADIKKTALNFSQDNTALVSKQGGNGSASNLAVGSGPSSLLPHFGSNTNSPDISQGSGQKFARHQQHQKQEQHANPHSLQGQQRVHSEIHQLEPSCSRQSNKEPTTSLHRPPVNWMTGPDIRSHQHHNGPAFGNSSQGMLYIGEHSKDPESGTTASASVFDSSSNFHCLDVPHSGQSFYKGNELLLFGNETLENIHENSAWSPNKTGSGSTSMLGNMLIPSTLPTLVGDLALGDTNLSRPFLPSFSNEPTSCSKKAIKRSSQSSKRDKSTEDSTGSQGQECSGSFLSVSQLVDSSKSRPSNMSLFSVPFPEQDSTSAVCQSSTKNCAPKSVSSNYSAAALLSSSVVQSNNQAGYRKRRTSGTVHYPSSYGVPNSSCHSNNASAVGVQSQVTQAQYLPDLSASRPNDFQGPFLHPDPVPSFMLTNPTRCPTNHSYNVSNLADRSSEDNVSNLRHPHTAASMDVNSSHHTVATGRERIVASNSSNVMDFSYINMPSTVLPDDMNYTNPPPPPPFLPPHSYPVPVPVPVPVAPPPESLHSAPRLAMHPQHPSQQNSSIQSPSATTLTNFHLSTIFPEINDKVIC